MNNDLKVLRVFIASPSDLVAEREAVKAVADELNAVFAKEVSAQIQLLGWEDRLPGYGRAQAQINDDVDRADLFIGFLWRSWGSPPGDPRYTSGFEEEYHRASARREKTGTPEISLFFKDASAIRSQRDILTLGRVLEFRDQVASKALLFGTFSDLDEWRKKVRALMECHLLRMLKISIVAHLDVPDQLPPAAPAEESQIDKEAQTTEASGKAATQEVVQVWNQALEAIKKDELLLLPLPAWRGTLARSSSSCAISGWGLPGKPTPTTCI